MADSYQVMLHLQRQRRKAVLRAVSCFYGQGPVEFKDVNASGDPRNANSSEK